MTKEAIVAMISELVKRLDYDIWKEYFLPTPSSSELGGELDQLVDIVRRHLPKEIPMGSKCGGKKGGKGK